MPRAKESSGEVRVDINPMRSRSLSRWGSFPGVAILSAVVLCCLSVMLCHSPHFLFTLAVWLLGLIQGVFSHDCWRDTNCTGPQTAAFRGEWESNIFSPPTRTVTPKAAYDLDSGDHYDTNTTPLTNARSGIYFDFGLEVGGVVTIQFSVPHTKGDAAIGIAFTEAKDWIGRISDSSSGIYERDDGALYANFSSKGDHTYVMPVENLRGGFRYMTLFLVGSKSSVFIGDISVEISFQPTWSNLQAYQGYFHSDDDLLNKIWYSGAYTIQTNALHPSTGRAWPAPETQWTNDGDIGVGDTIITDGAKRDRTVWPGDMGVAIPSAFYSIGDIESVKNALATLFNIQGDDGLLPFSGPPLLATDGDTYHMWTMIGMYNYVLYSGDVDFIRQYWPKYLAAMNFIEGQLDPSLGLLNISGYTNDWGRFYVDNTLTSAQVLYYRTLITGSALATWIGDTTGINSTWAKAAAKLQEIINELLWDDDFGAFDNSIESRDNETGLYPQDANALALLFGVVNATSDEGQKISLALTKNWTPIGAETPELPGEVSPFISSFEIQAHLLAGQTQRALDLIRTSWGWYLNNENGTQSTMVEGYLTDGTFGYRHDAGYQEVYSYTSHSHGWSTGPVTALSEYIVGIGITGLAGSTWRIAPQFGDLPHAEGGFTTSLGKFSAKWVVGSDGSYVLNYNTPKGTSGVLDLPAPNKNGKYNVKVDGQAVATNIRRSTETAGNRYLYIIEGSGGEHQIEVS
ncbi:glycoside hydrolase family 78 protein [Hypoxylon trugodes]|uniref:glycoside hydrolase family 78 protein n=1 Tax=Hypoxylon trugodes TaxID=326681 RepID=UPI0021925F56|nr:glycoside hydrolase family 78 protein [Hypoxylon trugodes]KAI1387398.1 glycoside hydrolase family 78 protein [Hypoxylon trugodes]